MKIRFRSSGPDPSDVKASFIRPTLLARPVSTSVQPSSFSRSRTLMAFFRPMASTR